MSIVYCTNQRLWMKYLGGNFYTKSSFSNQQIELLTRHFLYFITKEHMMLLFFSGRYCHLKCFFGCNDLSNKQWYISCKFVDTVLSFNVRKQRTIFKSISQQFYSTHLFWTWTHQRLKCILFGKGVLPRFY